MFYNSEINILIKLSPLFDFENLYFKNNKSGNSSKTISAVALRLHKLICCLKMILYNICHKPEINIDQIISPFGLKTSRSKEKSCDNS